MFAELMKGLVSLLRGFNPIAIMDKIPSAMQKCDELECIPCKWLCNILVGFVGLVALAVFLWVIYMMAGFISSAVGAGGLITLPTITFGG